MRKVVIGLEVHCELKTITKNFSASKNEYTNIPNIHVTPVDLGLPGILPVVNMEAVKKALKTAMALNCTNPDEVLFDRKNYYYPDLPKGYQITQVTKPMGKNGYLKIVMPDYEKDVLIHQLHLEEDTASLDHYSTYSLIDYNRSGIPLIEIVTEPCISTSDEAVKFLETLREVFIYCGVSEADSKKGQMRCDVNISLTDSDQLGTKVEMKNINSIKGAYKALKFELVRQKNLMKRGVEIKQETRAYLESQMITVGMRLKEDADDYRFIPDPDLPPMEISEEQINNVLETMPEAPHNKVKRFVEEYNIDEESAKVLTSELDLAIAYEEVAKEVDSKFAAQWMRDELKRVLSYNKLDFAESGITAKHLVEFLNMLINKEITTKAGQRIIENMPNNEKSPKAIAEELGLLGVVKDDEIIAAVKQAIEENPKAVNDYLEGQKASLNFLVGQVMRLTRGKADPGETVKLLKDNIE